MLSGFPQQVGTKQERKLCKIFSSLNDANRLTLMKFAEFLLIETDDEIKTNEEKEGALASFPEPKVIPAPENENVIKAIKRIAEMYYMVDKSKMLDMTSTLMTEHLMHGRPVQEVVAAVEKGFKQEYDKLYVEYKKKNGSRL